MLVCPSDKLGDASFSLSSSVLTLYSIDGVLYQGRNRVEGAQNVQWALLNLVEFLYNF